MSELDDVGVRLMVCTHCDRADLSKSHAPCTADDENRYIGDIAQAGDCPLKRYPKAGAARLAHGAAGLVKAAAGIDAAPPSVVTRRQNICRNCTEVRTWDTGEIRSCGLCGCRLKAKTAIAKESCPINRWTATGKRLGIVQLARFGDILGLLPLLRWLSMQGQEVHQIVHPAFETLVNGLSYVTPHVWSGPEDGVSSALAMARGVADEVIPTQEHGNPLQQPADNYLIGPWVRAGCAELFDSLPLILDNRDPVKEQALYRLVLRDDRRPAILVSTRGTSSPYRDGGSLLKWAREKWGQSANFVDLNIVQAERLQNLCGLFDRAAVLIGTDSAPIHLARASDLPTIGVVHDTPYRASPRRSHWIERLTYSESLTQAGRDRIAAAIDAEIAKPSPPHIVHIVDDSWRPSAGSEDYNRLARAAATWTGHRAWTTARLRHPRRTSASIGDTRTMPFVRDLLDFGCELAEPGDLVCFTNSDISLTPEAPDAIRDALAKGPCCYGPRAIVPPEVARTEPRLTREQLKTFRRDELPRHDDGGTDLFAFRPEWWRKRRDEFPDLILGCARWDIVMVHLMLADNPHAGIRPPIIWHEHHEPFWGRAENINDNPGQLWNKTLAQAWLRSKSIPAGN